MNTLENGQNRNRETHDHAEVGPEATSSIKNSGNRDTAGQDTSQQICAANHPFRLRDTPTFDRVTRIITLIGLAATIGTLAVNYYELRAIRGQLVAAVEANTLYKRQANAAEDSLSFAKASALSADRPWLIPSVRPTVIPASSSDWSIYVDAQNVGRSPANNAVEKEEAFISGPTDPAFDVEQCQDCASYVIGPSLLFTSSSKLVAPNLNADVLSDLRSGKRVLYVHGRIDYDDISKQHHKSIYCFFYNIAAEVFSACGRPQSNYSD